MYSHVHMYTYIHTYSFLIINHQSIHTYIHTYIHIFAANSNSGGEAYIHIYAKNEEDIQRAYAQCEKHMRNVTVELSDVEEALLAALMISQVYTLKSV